MYNPFIDLKSMVKEVANLYSDNNNYKLRSDNVNNDGINQIFRDENAHTHDTI